MHPLPDPPTAAALPRLDSPLRVDSPPVPVHTDPARHPASPASYDPGQPDVRPPLLMARGEHLANWLRDAEEHARVIREREAAEQLRLARLQELGRLANAD